MFFLVAAELEFVNGNLEGERCAVSLFDGIESSFQASLACDNGSKRKLIRICRKGSSRNGKERISSFIETIISSCSSSRLPLQLLPFQSIDGSSHS